MTEEQEINAKALECTLLFGTNLIKQIELTGMGKWKVYRDDKKVAKKENTSRDIPNSFKFIEEHFEIFRELIKTGRIII